MAQSVAILGRQPALGFAELESLFGADRIRTADRSAVLDADPDTVPIERLGGTVKLCKPLTTLPFTDWRKITDYLVEHVPKHTCCYGPGKLTFGISAYGIKTKPSAINATALEIKKAVRQSGRPVRVVPNKDLELSSAQILHNKLTDLPLGMELILVRDGSSTLLAQTVAVQDIEAYAARDQQRPKRDARVGMLPPKLAQTIINLAVGTLENQAGILMDPFCGTGVVLQEALLMGFDVYGTDLEPRMIEYSSANLQWLKSHPRYQQQVTGAWRLEVGDATETSWETFDFIACETYLGRPFSALPKPEVLSDVMRDVDTIHRKFLQNVARQTQPGFRMCIAVPAWRLQKGFKHLKVLDSLGQLGYTQVKFVHAPDSDLVYHRPDQVVGRELIVLERV